MSPNSHATELVFRGVFLGWGSMLGYYVVLYVTGFKNICLIDGKSKMCAKEYCCAIEETLGSKSDALYPLW